MGEASKTKAKAAAKTEPSGAKKVLGKRVNVASSTKLGKDVHAPKWLRAFGGYFAGSYRELRQVKWPKRRAAWSLTLAVLVFTAVLVVFILSLDYGFEQLFKKVLL